MSFNLAALISGSNNKKNNDNEKIEVNNEKNTKNIKNEKSKKSYSHGINVIMINGIYKGYLGIVSDFYPATYELTTSGEAFVDADKYGSIQPIGTKIMSNFGESKIKRIVLGTNSQSIVKLVIYKENEVLKIGRVFNMAKSNEKNIVFKHFDSNEIENSNNKFVVELSLFDDSLIMDLDKLTVNQSLTNEIIDKMNKLHIKDKSSTAPIQLIEQLSNELKHNSNLLDIITYPERDNSIKPKIVYNKDIVGNSYYMSIYGNNLGKFTDYNPLKNQYYISYIQNVQFKPSMIEIQKDKRFAKVKKGLYSKQIFKIKSYNQARLSITLATNGLIIQQHSVQDKDKGGYQVKPIYQSDVFYIDITLKNDNKAQVLKVLDDDKVNIIEKQINEFVPKTISILDIATYEQGFSFNTGTNQVNEPIDFDNFLPSQIEDQIEYQIEQQDDEDNEDEKEHDYEENEDNEDNEYDNENDNNNEEGKPKASFKDSQRTSYEQKSLTSQQMQYKNEIEKVIRLLNLSDDTINIYTSIDNVQGVISSITKQLKNIGYTQNINVTSNIKFIIVCIVIYDLIKIGFYKNVDTIISKLFPKYFTIKDISTSNINDNIFLKEWNKLNNNIVTESISKIKEYRKNENNYQNIIKVLLMNCDKVIQNIMNLRLDIDSSNKLREEDLIPLGLNKLTGKRYKDEQEELDLLKSKNYKNKAVQIKDLIKNNIPENEAPIIWGDSIIVLDKYKEALQKKYDSQNIDSYLYIMNNLHRSPFALKESMPRNVKQMFESTYKHLLGTIVDRQTKLEKNKNNKRKHDEEVMEYRNKINTKSLFGEDSDEEQVEPIQNTRKYERERKIREMQKSITKSTIDANRNAQKDKKIRAQKDKEETNTTDETRETNTSDEMDTSE